MVFIVKRKVSGKDYYYLQESKREGAKVKSICLAYLGKDRKQAEKKKKEFLEKRSAQEKVERAEKNSQQKKISIEELANFCKRKGFIFRSSDIYGGFAGFWDFGPLGVELFNNIKQDWWDFFVRQRQDVVGIEASVISHPRTWKVSGHIENFNDIFVKCKKCGKTNKLDENELGKIKCECGGDYESQGKFNLMFKTEVGAGQNNSETAYLRGETAQGMFMDFKLVQQTSRMQLPFGIAQVGRCFRNEIAPRDFLFRSREFHIGEFEFFINPEEKKCGLLDEEHLKVEFDFLSEENQKNNSEKKEKVKIKDLVKKKKLGEWHAYWLAEQVIWFHSIGLDKIKIREHTKEELSHYSSATFDIDYEYVFGSKEVAGNANRGQYDLTQHAKESKEKMEIFDEKIGKKVLPRVIEPTFGIERIFLAILTKAYFYDEKRKNIVLKIPARLASMQVAIFPLVKTNEKLVEISKRVYEDLKKDFHVFYDEGGSVGRRYARQDEIGTPFCITIDTDSIKNGDVTIRDRDTTKQIRVKIKNLKKKLDELIFKKINFEKAGKVVR